jgi:hypothetical protein
MNEKLLAANGKIVRHNGVAFRVISCRLGSRVLADADPITGQGNRINLVSTRSTLGMALRKAVELNLVS